MPSSTLLFMTGLALGDLVPLILGLGILVAPPILFFKLFLLRKYEKKNVDQTTDEKKPFGRLRYFLSVLAIGLVASIMLTQSSDASAISIITAIFATAVMEKRFRDIGFSRWWAVMGLASLIPPIAILAAWAHILCLITPALSRKSIQKKEPPKNNSSHRIQPLQQEKCRTRILQQPSRIKRKTWIIGSLAVIVISIALIVFLSNRHLINRELGPLILATELNPNDPYAWTSLAGGAYRASRHSMAEDAAKKAITLGQRGQSGGYLWLGRIYRDQNKNEEAIYCYQRATGVHARTDLGDFYHQLGDYEKSIEQYLKAIDLLLKETKKEDVGWWDWNSLGDVYLKLGKKKEAHDAFATALTLGVDLDSIKEKMAITSY